MRELILARCLLRRALDLCDLLPALPERALVASMGRRFLAELDYFERQLAREHC